MNYNLRHKIIKYLNSEYGNIERYTIPHRWPSYTFFMKDGEVIFTYNTLDNKVHVCHEKIWSLLKTFFELDDELISITITEWVRPTYKLPIMGVSSEYSGLVRVIEEQYKLKTNDR